MGGKGKLKRKKPQSGNKISPPESNKFKNIDYPVFCFKYLQKGYSITDLDANNKSALLEQLYKLSQLSWSNIQTTHRHGMGTEKIDQNSIKPPLPSFVTKEVTLLALRYLGKQPFVGYRFDHVFHILYIDHNFTVYPH